MKASVAAALAASALAQAFLLPPEVSETDIAAAEAAAAQFAPATAVALKGSERQTMFLDCPNCPVPVVGKHGILEGLAVRPNHLKLVLHVDHGDDGQPDKLMLNNMEVYPALDPARPFLIATQFVDEGAEGSAGEADEKKKAEKDEKDAKKEHKDEEGIEDLRRDIRAINRHHKKKKHFRGRSSGYPQRLGFGLSVQPPIVGADDSHLELIKMHLQIIEVGQAFIDGIPGVDIDLVRSADTGRLMIARVEGTQPQAPAPATPLNGQPKEDAEPSTNPADFDRCASGLCRWLVALRAKMQAFARKHFALIKGHHCMHHHHKVPQAAAADAQATAPAPMSPEEAAARPAYHHGGYHPGHRHGHHLKHILKSLVAHILLPILVGVVAGVTVSLVGVVLGTLAVSVWRFASGRRLCRGGQCPRLAAKLRPAGPEAAEEEKVGLMEYQDLPPQHQDEVQTPKQDARKDGA